MGGILVIKTLHHHLTITITSSHGSRRCYILLTLNPHPAPSSVLVTCKNNFPEQRQADVPPPSPPPPKNPRPPGDTPTTPLAASAPAPACDSRQPPAFSPQGGVWPIRAAGPKGEGEEQMQRASEQDILSRIRVHGCGHLEESWCHGVQLTSLIDRVISHSSGPSSNDLEAAAKHLVLRCHRQKQIWILKTQSDSDYSRAVCAPSFGLLARKTSLICCFFQLMNSVVSPIVLACE